MPQSRFFSAIVLFAIPALAFANYGMSIAYSVFDKRYWSIYVIVTVIFEALAIAWWFRLSIWRGLWTSLIANSATAFVMVLVAAFLPLGEGDVRNPSPLLWCLRIFAVLAILSAITEAVIWSRFLDKRMALQKRYVFPSIAIHAIGFIIGFAILLVPSHPFVSLEMDLARLHSLRLKSQLPVAFDNCFRKTGKLPVATKTSSLLKELDRYSSGIEEAAYDPQFDRLGRATSKRKTIFWQSGLAGVNLNDFEDGRLLIMRVWGLGAFTVYLDAGLERVSITPGVPE